MEKLLLVSAVVAASGCGAQGDPMLLAGQNEAVRLAWNETYGETGQPPKIYWRWDHCDQPNGKYAPLPCCTFDNDGEQVAGLQSDSGWIELGGPWQTGLMSDTSIAHELLHASIGDADHRSAAWTTLLPAAERRIKDAGL